MVKRYELETKLKKRAEHIKESNLYDKCAALAIRAGESTHWKQHSDYIETIHVFENSELELKITDDDCRHALSGIGATITVDYTDEVQFIMTKLHIKSIDIDSPDFEVRIGDDRYQVSTYKAGEWENHVRDLYTRLMSDLSPEEIDAAEKKFGIELKDSS